MPRLLVVETNSLIFFVDSGKRCQPNCCSEYQWLGQVVGVSLIKSFPSVN